MLDDNEFEPQWLKVGVAAELAKRYGEEGHDFMNGLALMLEGALPEATQIERSGNWFGPKKLQRIIITLNDIRYVLATGEHGALQATCTHIVRGIALKTETFSVPEWLELLGAALQERAQTHRVTREALANWVEI